MTETGRCKRCGHYKIRHRWVIENDGAVWKGSFLVPFVHSWHECSECNCHKFK